MPWNTDDSLITEVWPEYEDMTPVERTALMSTAHALCAAYAPPLAAATPIPDSYKLAEIFTARDIARKSNGSGEPNYGPDGAVMPIQDLTYLARNLLRPMTPPLRRLR